jgi:WD40 repeat protein
MTNHTNYVYAVKAWNSTHMVSSSQDSTLRLWFIQNGSLIMTVVCPPISAFTVQNDGNLTSGSPDGYLRMWDPRLNLIRYGATSSINYIDSVNFVDSSRLIFMVGSYLGQVRLFNPQTGVYPTILTTNSPSGQHVFAILRINTNMIATGGEDGLVTLWDWKKQVR